MDEQNTPTTQDIAAEATFYKEQLPEAVNRMRQRMWSALRPFKELSDELRDWGHEARGTTRYACQSMSRAIMAAVVGVETALAEIPDDPAWDDGPF